ncbi:hypothetical protein ACE6H2_016529 [Prunus campanulata]
MGSEPTKLAVSTISEPITTMLLIFSSFTLLASFSASETEIASNQSVKTEQISVSLSANYDSVWISWVTGPIGLFVNFCCRGIANWLQDKAIGPQKCGKCCSSWEAEISTNA